MSVSSNDHSIKSQSRIALQNIDSLTDDLKSSKYMNGSDDGNIASPAAVKIIAKKKKIEDLSSSEEEDDDDSSDDEDTSSSSSDSEDDEKDMTRTLIKYIKSISIQSLKKYSILEEDVKKCIKKWISDDVSDIPFKIQSKKSLDKLYLETYIDCKKKDYELISDSKKKTKKEVNVTESMNLNSFENDLDIKHACNIILNIGNIIDDDGSVNYSSKEESDKSIIYHMNKCSNILGDLFLQNNFLNSDNNLFLLSFMLPLIKPERFENGNKNIYNILIAIFNEVGDEELAKLYIKEVLYCKASSGASAGASAGTSGVPSAGASTKLKSNLYNDKCNEYTFNDFIKEIENDIYLRKYFIINIIKYIPQYIFNKLKCTHDEFVFNLLIFRKVYKSIIESLFHKFSKKKIGNTNHINFVWSSNHEKNCILFFMDTYMKNPEIFKENYSNHNSIDPNRIIDDSSFQDLLNEMDIEKEENFIYTSIRTIGDYAESDNPVLYEKFYKKWYMIPLTCIITEYKEMLQDKIYNTKLIDDIILNNIFGIFLSRLLWRKIISTESEEDSSRKSIHSTYDWYNFENSTYLKKISESVVSNIIKDKSLGILTAIHNRTNEDINLLTREFNTTKKKNKKRCTAINEEIKILKVIKTKLKKIITVIDNQTVKNMKDFLNTIGNNKLIKVNDFYKYCNKNPSILPFENCVVELNKKSFIVRKGIIEDYYTKNCGIKYEYNQKYVEEAEKYIRQVFCMEDEKVYEYILRVLTSFLYGRNSDKVIQVWTGKGNNSKSILIKIFKKMLGDFYATFKSNEIATTNRNKDTEAANSSVAKAEDTRQAVITEPPEDFCIDSGMMKRHTGGDDITARKMYKDTKEFIATYTLVLCCNNPPEVEGNDKATKDRILMVPFESTWTENPPVSVDEQHRRKIFKIDTDFERKVPIIARGLIWILVNNYKNYKKYGIKKAPDYIVKLNETYWNNINIFNNFVSNSLEKDNDRKDYEINYVLTPRDAYIEFSNFWEKINPNVRMRYNLKKFKEGMNPLVGDLRKFKDLEKEGFIKDSKKYEKKYESTECWIHYRSVKKKNEVKDDDKYSSSDDDKSSSDDDN